MKREINHRVVSAIALACTLLLVAGCDNYFNDGDESDRDQCQWRLLLLP